jgi:hypothetical protein
MFGNKKTSLDSDIKTLQSQLKKSMDKIEMLVEENNEYKETIGSFINVKASYEQNLEKMAKDYDNKVKALQEALKATELSVNQKVNEALTCIGVSTFPNETIVAPSTSPTEKLETFQSLSGVERSEYYTKNKADITRALGIS